MFFFFYFLVLFFLVVFCVLYVFPLMSLFSVQCRPISLSSFSNYSFLSFLSSVSSCLPSQVLLLCPLCLPYLLVFPLIFVFSVLYVLRIFKFSLPYYSSLPSKLPHLLISCISKPRACHSNISLTTSPYSCLFLVFFLPHP